MNRIIFLTLLAGLGLQPLPSLGQNAGVPKGSKLQPVITERMLREAQEGHPSQQSGKPKSKTTPKPNSSSLTPQKKSVASNKPTLEKQKLSATRAWADDTGKHIVEAAFIGLQDDQVILLKSDGKRVTIPLAQLSNGDQQYAENESRVLKTRDEYDAKLEEMQTAYKKLEAEQKRLDAKKNKSRDDLIRRRDLVDEQLSLSTETRKLKEERDQKIRKLYNDYAAATGQKPLYVDDGHGRLESRDVLVAKENDRTQRQEVAKVAGTPRLAADSYIKTLLGDEVLREADYQSEQFVTPGPKRDATDKALGKAFGVPGNSALGPIADPMKWKAVYYRVQYVSRAGVMMEKDAYVLTYRKENARVIGPGAQPEDGAVWGVDGLYIDDIKAVEFVEPKPKEQLPQPASRSQPTELVADETQLKVIFKDWAARRGAALKKAAEMPNKREGDEYMRSIDQDLVKTLTAKYKITHEELDRIEAYGAQRNWW